MSEGGELARREDEFVAEYNQLDDPFLQYEYLLAYRAELDELPEAERTPATKIAGCTSNAWMTL